MNTKSDAPAWRRALKPLASAGLALLCTACTTIGPKPWQKDLMSRREMQVGAYSLQAAAEDHIYFSKEASSGGRGFAGGGCGCN
ncbi:MAG: DUF4266 domain-containing protein [Rhizomicrobium sp.]